MTSPGVRACPGRYPPRAALPPRPTPRRLPARSIRCTSCEPWRGNFLIKIQARPGKKPDVELVEEADVPCDVLDRLEQLAKVKR